MPKVYITAESMQDRDSSIGITRLFMSINRVMGMYSFTNIQEDILTHFVRRY